MEDGDRAGAIAAFEEARAGRPDSGAALLEGICLYEDGEYDPARRFLREAEADPAHREKARFFLGLIAMRAGRSSDAAALLDASAADRRLAPMAFDLSRLARREGRLVASLLLESGWSSNVDLAPDASTPSLGGHADASAGATALLRLAPLGDAGPFLRASFHHRDQATYNALDITGYGAAGGWQVGHGGRYGLAEYQYEHRDLGGAPYLDAHRILGTARLAFDAVASAGLTYFARFETFLPPAYADYSGVRQLAEADLTFDLGRRATATIAWHVGRDAARATNFSWWENGPRGALRLPLGRDVRLGVDAEWSWRHYDQRDPGYAAARADGILDLAALLEADLSDRWMLRVSFAARKAFSNAPEFAYTQFVPMLGFAYSIGLW
jgi:hypothetical protein